MICLSRAIIKDNDKNSISSFLSAKKIQRMIFSSLADLIFEKLIYETDPASFIDENILVLCSEMSLAEFPEFLFYVHNKREFYLL